ncbi:MAG: glycosyltransferase family 2 protein, partial [Gemmatimonadales bacterium]
ALFLPLDILVALPLASDLISLAKVAARRSGGCDEKGVAAGRLLFLVPAHDEELLIERCLHSLMNQAGAEASIRIVVVADNCTDGTAQRAKLPGVTVLERLDTGRRGKGHAVAWALETLKDEDFDAVAIVDADTIVEPDFTSNLLALGPLRSAAVQSYDGLSNEFETWLTILAGLNTRNRYGISLPLKEAAGLSIPLTGDGTILGTQVLEKVPWNPDTITEGWDLYVRLSLAGYRPRLANGSVLYAQEAKTMRQGASQRLRWTSGRSAVLRQYWRQIIGSEGLSIHQRLDMIAELTSPGPVVQVGTGILGTGFFLLVCHSYLGILTGALFTAPIIQQIGYSLTSLARHPSPSRVVAAFLRLPGYIVWRMGLEVQRRITHTKGWVRTGRHAEGSGSGGHEADR